MLANLTITNAQLGDIPGIINLQECNMRDKGGALSVRLEAKWFESTIAQMPIIVARRAANVVGYVASSPVSMQAEIPIVKAMLRAYAGAPGAYIYGPICVAESERGNGIADAMVKALQRSLPGREGFTFIRSDNTVSRQVHRRLGMREAAVFNHADVDYVIVSYMG